MSAKWSQQESFSSLMDQARRKKATRWIAMGAFVICAGYSVIYGLQGMGPVAILYAGLTLSFGTVGTVLVSRHTRAAAILLLATGLLSICLFQFVVVAPQAGGSEFFLLIAPFALMTMDARDRNWRWFFSVTALLGFALRRYGWRLEIEEWQIMMSDTEANMLRVFSALGAGVFLTLIFHFFYRDLNHARAQLHEAHAQSESLLLNILPSSIATRLKGGTELLADGHEEATVLFADIVGFTPLSSRLSAEELVVLLNAYFTAFDELTDRHEVEKIKTIGDAYMVAAGVPGNPVGQVERVLSFAQDMLAAVDSLNEELNQELTLRIGVNTGPVTAGVIGSRKFVYDLWGDAVNIASRMESSGIPGRVQVSSSVVDQRPKGFDFESRGLIDIKGKGEMEVFLLALPQPTTQG